MELGVRSIGVGVWEFGVSSLVFGVLGVWSWEFEVLEFGVGSWEWSWELGVLEFLSFGV